MQNEIHNIKNIIMNIHLTNVCFNKYLVLNNKKNMQKS
jgi:hypothetical protein